MKKHLLVIDDAKIRHLLNQYLTRSGFNVTEAEDSRQSEALLKLFSFDAIVMDVMMPYQNGVEYTRILRQKGMKTPILMLTAMGDTLSRISGLEAGADDYLSKPFEPKELVLRLHNLLKHQEEEKTTFGPFLFENNYLRKGKQRILLTATESALLKALMATINQPVAREELARLTQTKTLRTIDVQITRLRQKVEEDVKHPFWIQTIRGKGYKLVNS